MEFRQFFGRSARYHDACIELRFQGHQDPVALDWLNAILPTIVPDWRTELPRSAMLEDAIALIVQALLESRIPTWAKVSRNGDQAWVAIGPLDPQITHSALDRIYRLLTCAPGDRPQMAKSVATLVARLSAQQAVNYAAMTAARGQGIEPTWLLQPINIFQLGQGVRGVQYCELGNGRDTFTGTMIETSKANTVMALAKLGLPTTNGTVAYTADEAVKIANTIGFPCVVKPIGSSKGKGVTVGITTEEDVREAFAATSSARLPGVLVESHVPGIDHRIMVANGRVIWTYSRTPAQVVGDGSSTIRALVEQENARRRKNKTSAMAILEQIAIGSTLEAFLKRAYGLAIDAVLEAGRTIELSGPANLVLGGVPEDVTARLHPDNMALALQVARYLRMNTLGVDLITPDISKSWKEVRSAIIEVNRTPGISGPGDASIAIRSNFPRKGDGQIPVFVAVGDGAFLNAAAEKLRAAIAVSGLRVAIVDYLALKGVPKVFPVERPPSLQRALLHPDVDAIILLCDPARLDANGFPLLRADLAYAQDPSAIAYLSPAIDHIAPLPADDTAIAKHLAAIVARHARDGELIPVLSVDPQGQTLQFRCLRFAATPREWFFRKLGLTDGGTQHMIDYRDIASAATQLANRALLARDEAALDQPLSFEQPADPWARPFVTATLTVPGKAASAVADAFGEACQAINAVLAIKPS